MAEPPLQLSILGHWPHVGGTENLIISALLSIPHPHRVQSAFDDQTAQVNRPGSLVHEALLTRRIHHQESTPFMFEALSYFIHHIDGISNTRRRHVAMWMPSGHHASEVLGIKFLSLWNFRPRRRESCHAAVRCAR